MQQQYSVSEVGFLSLLAMLMLSLDDEETARRGMASSYSHSCLSLKG